MNWIPLNEQVPSGPEDVIGGHWWGGEKDDDFQMHICESEAHDVYWCGEKTNRKSLAVKNSICPQIGHGKSPYWMPLPLKEDPRWINYDHGKSWTESSSEVLIRLKNGNHYIGFFQIYWWCPSFNMMRSGDLEDVEAYMDLPPIPPFIKDAPVSEEERVRLEKVEKDWMEQFEKRSKEPLRFKRSE